MHHVSTLSSVQVFAANLNPFGYQCTAGLSSVSSKMNNCSFYAVYLCIPVVVVVLFVFLFFKVSPFLFLHREECDDKEEGNKK